MREFLLAKNIALSIEHIKVSRKTEGQNDSDSAVVMALNAAGSSLPGWESIKAGQLTEFRHGRARGKVGVHALILQAAETLLRNDKNHVSFAEMERRYGHKLPPMLAQAGSATLQGDEMKDTAELFQGAWTFFYLSPIGRKEKKKPEFRSFGVLVPHINSTSRVADFIAISGRSRWQGEAFVNQSHIYMVCSDVNRTETAFFLTSKPRKDSSFLSGIGSALERDLDRAVRPAIGFFCFGQKWTSSSPEAAGTGQRGGGIKKGEPQIEQIIARVLDRDQMARHEEEALRRHFCTSYSIAGLRKDFPDLLEYLGDLKLNGGTEFDRTWLYLQWPN